MHPPEVQTALAEAGRRHWRRNVVFSVGLLCLWAAVGVLFADALDEYSLGGFPLGFWFAQQGAILVFVVLILVYALGMAVLDRVHRRERQRIVEGGAR